MSRVKRGVTAHARHRKVITLSKGFVGRSKNCFRSAIERLEKSMQYAYRDRRTKKRDFRRLWIMRINAAAREHGLKYSEFMYGLQKSGIVIDRKVLSELAINDKAAFGEIVKKAEAVLS